MKTIIIGGVAGGASAAARLRRLDENAEIILLEKDEYVSYANCGLPYYIGDTIVDQDSLTLQTPESLRRRLKLDVRTENEAVSINRKAHTVTVKRLDSGETYEESYDKLILAPGSSAIRPRLPGIDNERVFTLRNIPDTLRMKAYIDKYEPERAVIVGGGAIGLEMAENLFRLGIEVTVVEMLDHIIPALDIELAKVAQNYLKDRGINIILSNGVSAIEDQDGSLLVRLQDGELKADFIIMSVGVRPESALAAACGLEVDERGFIIVNDHMQTSDEDIYAVGDAVEAVNFVTGKKGRGVPLAGPANKQGRVAADNIGGIPSVYKGTQASSVVKLFKMTVAMTGLNEKGAKDSGIDYDKTYLWPESHAAYYPDATHMYMKVLFEKKTGRILGAQIVGYEGVDKRCDVLATAIRAGMTGSDLAELELCYAPPYSSAKDPVNMAGFVIQNLVAGRFRQVFWDDVEKLKEDTDLQIVDLRPIDSYMDGFIDGAVSIPLAQLRSRLEKLDKTKPILLYCNMGGNSYTASCALKQLGYNCVSLAGGYQIYEPAVSE